ncbi:MAG TPA: hypothetical protein VD928_03370 [Candidatus Paceibacterota bacterium]|nr:hypothetical protein [Candidatus Paceibacterota bacterium]
MPPTSPIPNDIPPPPTPESSNTTITSHHLPRKTIWIIVSGFAFIFIIGLASASYYKNIQGEEPDSLTTQNAEVENVSTTCAENPIGSISNGFASTPGSQDPPKFNIVATIPRASGILSVTKGNPWVAENKLAYIVAKSGADDILYFDGKEILRAPFINPLEEITDKFAYFFRNGRGSEFTRYVIYGDQKYPFNDNVADSKIVDEKPLVIGSSGGTYLWGDKILSKFEGPYKFKEIVFGIDGKSGHTKTVDLGTQAIEVYGDEVELPKLKHTFMFEGKEYGTELGGIPAENIHSRTIAVLCNGKPVYIVKASESLLDVSEFVVYEGKIIGGPYYVLKLAIVGGSIIVHAQTQEEKFILTKDGTEIGSQYDSITGFHSHEGHLVYVGVNDAYSGIIKLQVQSPTGKMIEKVVNKPDPHFAVLDNTLIYQSESDEYIRLSEFADDVISVGTKLAFLIRDPNLQGKKVVYDGKDVLQEYSGKITKIFELNGKLAAVIKEKDKELIVSEQ